MTPMGLYYLISGLRAFREEHPFESIEPQNVLKSGFLKMVQPPFSLLLQKYAPEFAVSILAVPF